MKAEWARLDLIDLISERHLMLRKITEDLWNENSELHISNSEWFIMARIYKKNPTVSYVTKNIDISRQAVHKFIRSLESKGLVEILNVEGNKKEKSIRLTSFGEECYERNLSLKASLEEKIASNIGQENLQRLHEILKLDWGI